MISSELISVGILTCLTGTLSGGILALFSGKKPVQRIAQAVIMISLLIGAVATGIFLMKGMQSLVLLNDGSFFPGKLVIDQLSAIFFFLVNAVGLLAVFYGAKYILNENGHYNLAYIQCLTALFILGMQLVVLATTPVFFVFAWEIMSFSSFLLVMADLKSESIKPAIFYLVMTHLGAGAIIAAFLLLSGGAIAVDFSMLAVLAAKLPAVTIIAVFSLFFFGFGSKAGLFPFHGWLPEAHPQAPSHISALMSGIMLKIAVYGMIRVLLYILPVLPVELGYTMIVIGLFSAIFGVFYSVIETDIKRILAFSSIENLGLIFSIIGIFMVARSQQMELLANVALVAALYQSICHALFKSGLFLSAGVAGQAFHTRNIEKMGGMAKHMKMFSLAVLLLILTASALPPSGAFFGEWLVIQSIINNISSAVLPVQLFLLATLVSFGLVAGIAVFSMVRFFGIGFLAEPRTKDAHVEKDPSFEMLLPIMVLGIFAFLIGSIAKPLLNLIGNDLATDGIKLSTESLNSFTFNPLILLGLIFGLFILAWLFRKASSDTKNEREYHTWDCGQPIDASMEYTATAFSSPIRFFFSSLLRANKKVSSKPIVETNPWLVKKSVDVEVRPVWNEYFYNPIVRLVTSASSKIRRLQNGNIQFYITMILISLIITAIVAL